MKNTYIPVIALFIFSFSVVSCSTSEKRYDGPHTLKQPSELTDETVNEENREISREDAGEGLAVGTVSSVSYNKKEITVNQNKVVDLGSVVYVIIDGREVLMTVTFPMMTSFRCIVVPNQLQYLGRIKKNMTVYLKQ